MPVSVECGVLLHARGTTLWNLAIAKFKLLDSRFALHTFKGQNILFELVLAELGTCMLHLDPVMWWLLWWL